MLWQYIEIMFIVSGLSTILAFHKLIDKLGQVFFLLFGGITWMGFAISLLQIEFKFSGSQNIIPYTYIPGEESPFIFIFGIMGLMMFGIGCIRAAELTYKPLLRASDKMLGRTKYHIMDEEDE